MIKGLTTGRIVHYVRDSGHNLKTHEPAIVTHVFSDASGEVNLAVFNAMGEQRAVLDVPHAPFLRTVHSWHFIEQV